jgi:hypothetical protein
MPHGAGLWFFVLLLVLGAIVGAFFGGVFLAREEAKITNRAVQALQDEVKALRDQLAAAKQDQIVLERTVQIDRETARTAQENCKQQQSERLELEKEVSFLKRLIREGGGGVLKVQDFELTPGEGERLFAYSFTVSQMIQEFSESAGNVVMTLVGKRDDKEVTLGLGEMPGSEPASHKIRFKHFQKVEGVLKIPEDIIPEAVVIEVKPTTKKLIPVTETYPWDSGE